MSPALWQCLPACLKCRNPLHATISLSRDIFHQFGRFMTHSLCRSKVCITRSGEKVESHIPRIVLPCRRGILSTRHKLSFPNFPSSSGSAATATLPENALGELFLVTDRVWKLEVVDPVCNWVSSPRLSHQGNKPFLTAIYRFWNQRKTRRKFHRCANLCSNSGHKFPSNAS